VEEVGTELESEPKGDEDARRPDDEGLFLVATMRAAAGATRDFLVAFRTVDQGHKV